jgi:hypothetical protein
VFWGRSWASSGSKFSRNFREIFGQILAKKSANLGKKNGESWPTFSKKFREIFGEKIWQQVGKKSEIFFGKLGIFFKNFWKLVKNFAKFF